MDRATKRPQLLQLPRQLASYSPAESQARYFFWKPLLVLLAGLLLSGYLGHWVQVRIAADAQRDFVFDTQEAIYKIDARLKEQAQVLQGIAAFFEASVSVERAEFQAFAKHLKMGQHFDGVQGLGFSMLMTKAQLPQHEARVRQDGFPGYAVFPAGEREVYSSVVYLEPLDALNLRALGFDMHTDATRRAAMDEARDGNHAALSGKVTLKQETQKDSQPGTLMYMPVYRKGARVDTIGERRAAIEGWVYSPFRMQDFMQSILQNWRIPHQKTIQLKVYDGRTINESHLLFDSHPTNTLAPQNPGLLQLERLTNFNGRIWSLNFSQIEGIASNIDYSSAWLTFATGLLISVLLFLLTYSYLNTLRHARRISDQLTASQAVLTAELQAFEVEKFIEREWFRLQSTALEVCANAILIANAQGVILWVNPAFSKLSGYTLAESIGEKLQALVKSGVQDRAFYQVLWETVISGKPWRGELVNRRKNGTLYDEEMTITPVANEQGTITHFIVVKQDITLHKQAGANAKAANHAKSMFLANMSHEIRTPMNGVIGMVDVLQKTPLQPPQLRMLGTIQKSALTLLNILNDILDFSKIEAGKLDIERVPVDLRDLAESVMQLMVTTALTKSVNLSVYVSTALPRRVVTDPTRLRQVLLNLLGNAIKFSNGESGQPGGVILYVEPCTLEQAQAGVKFRLVDRGIGMSPDVQLRLFQPFMQADESTARKFGGTGLGLSITQRLVDLMGGRISVISTVGQGSEFSVELPLEAAPPSRMPVFGPHLTGVQVLTINQDAVLDTIVTSYCLDAGAKVTAMADLAAVQQYLQQRPPDAGPHVLLLAVDSYNATQAPHLPEKVGRVYLERIETNTTDDVLTVSAYPLHYSQLVRAIALASGLLNWSRDNSLSQPVKAMPEIAPMVDQALAAQRLILLADDNETNRDVIQQQIRMLGYDCELAEDGLVALQMWRSGRYALLLTDCHMPRMDGFALTTAIRSAEPEGTHVPIVAITANAMHGEAQRCLAHGMDDYLSKPMRMEDLAPVLHKWLPLPQVFVPSHHPITTLPKT